MSIATCNHKPCSRYKECWRAMCELSGNTPVDFKNICKDYNWFYPIGDKPVRKEKLT
jgi:hypothetical protein